MAEVRQSSAWRGQPDAPAGTIHVQQPATLMLCAVDVADTFCVMGCDEGVARRLSASVMRAVDLADRRGAPHVAVMDGKAATVELLYYARPPRDQAAYAAACREFGGAYASGRPSGGYRMRLAVARES